MILELLLGAVKEDETKEQVAEVEAGEVNWDEEEEEEEEATECDMTIRVVKDMIFFLSYEANVKPFLGQVNIFH